MAEDGETPRLDAFDDANTGESRGDGGDASATTDAGDADDGSPGDDTSANATRVDRPETRAGTVELGVELLAGLADDELSVKEAMDRIETVTRDPAVQREILDTAETRGVIDRADATIQTTSGGAPVRLERRVFQRNGEFDCRRCGAGLSTGYFVRFDTGDLGPFGSSCIEKVTGRD